MIQGKQRNNFQQQNNVKYDEKEKGGGKKRWRYIERIEGEILRGIKEINQNPNVIRKGD